MRIRWRPRLDGPGQVEGHRYGERTSEAARPARHLQTKVPWRVGVAEHGVHIGANGQELQLARQHTMEFAFTSGDDRFRAGQDARQRGRILDQGPNGISASRG